MSDSLSHYVNYRYTEHKKWLAGSQGRVMLLYRTQATEGEGVAETIRDRIKALRKKEKLTLDQLSEQAGLSKSYLWELENKELPRPSGEKLAGLAKVLNVTVDYLLGGDPTEKLEAAEDKAFFREYEAMTPEARARLRRLAKALDN